MSNIVMSDDKKPENNKPDIKKLLGKDKPASTGKPNGSSDATLVINRDSKEDDPDATVIANRSNMPELEKAVRESESAPVTGKLTNPDENKSGSKSKIKLADAHVLVVEDNVPNFVLIARLLAFMGIQRCEWKTSGWQVVEFADTLPRIDLVLMDIRLPYEDGYQALKRIRDHEKLKSTLVIAVTAEASAEQMRKAQESGFDGFLAKPLNPDKFPEQIKRVLNGEPVWEWQSG